MERMVTCTSQLAPGQPLACPVFDAGAAGAGRVLFLFAVACACWAITTRHAAFAGCPAGLVVAPVTGLVLLLRASQRRSNRP